MPCDEAEITKYVVTHEYGHILINYLLQNEYAKHGWNPMEADKFVDYNNKKEYKWYHDTKKQFQKQCKKEILEIAKKNNPKFNYRKNISTYGAKKDGEFLAEVFANSQLSQPNELGIAMQQWLKEKGF